MKTRELTVLILCGVILIASFMPWGSFQGTIDNPFGDSFFEDFPFGGTHTVTINGWNSNFTLLGLTVPNWILVFIALGIGALLFTQIKPLVSMLLSIYGIFQSGILLLILLIKGTIGIGLILTVLSFVIIFITLLKIKGETK